MSHRSVFSMLTVFFASAFLFTACHEDDPMDPGGPLEPGKTYQLTVNYDYTGAVTVDAAHKIFVGLFYTDFIGVVPDIGQESFTAAGSVTFDQVVGTPVRIGVVVDKNGDGMPSQGDPYELFNNQWQNATAIDLEAVNSISVTFDDSYSWDTSGNIAFTINGQATNFQKFSMAVFEPGVPRTYVFGSGNLMNGIPNIVLTFTNKNGARNQNNGAEIIYVDETGEAFASSTSSNATCLITVTAYGSVGGLIEGTFSGHLVKWDESATNVITGGAFSVRRWDDQ